MKTICAIQARLNSTRLPNKVLLPLGGKSMVENVFERVSRAKKIAYAVVAWPTDYDCDENDLVKRFLLCAKKHGADRIIRVCADNPCVEPEEIDALIKWADALDGKATYLILNSESPQDKHDGFGGECYTMEMLEWMNANLTLPVYREHPHKYYFDNDEAQYCGKHYPPGFRLDVNTQADYEKLKNIYDHFGHNRFTVKEVMEYLPKGKRKYEDLVYC